MSESIHHYFGRKEREWREDTDQTKPDAHYYVIGSVDSRKNEPRSKESGFYGHYLPSHFKKTSIIRTHGRA